MRLRSRTPPDRRTPAEPSGPPKPKGTAVKSKAKATVPNRAEARSESSSSSPEKARGSRPAPAMQASREHSSEAARQGTSFWGLGIVNSSFFAGFGSTNISVSGFVARGRARPRGPPQPCPTHDEQVLCRLWVNPTYPFRVSGFQSIIPKPQGFRCF